MKKQDLISRLALVAAISLSPWSHAVFADVVVPAIGAFASDGSIYGGESPDAHKPMYTTPADAPDPVSWSDANDYCSTLRSFGHDDWRVPSKKELEVLYENQKKEALNETFKEIGDSAGWYWSSSESDGGQAWVQNFGKGTQNQDYQDNRSSLRCVR
jgi:cytochrome c peroxidase